METLHNKLKNELATILLNATTKAFPSHQLTLSELYQALALPPKKDMGQYCFACFPLSKMLRNAPNKIAEIIGNSFEIADDSIISKVEALGPYLNFYLNFNLMEKYFLNDIQNDDFFIKDLDTESPVTMIEYSQPNTHKELHVGHMRNLCLGNSLVRIKKYCKQKVIPVTYPGDMGTHVAKALWYLHFHNKETAPKTNKGAWLGTMYSRGNLLLEDQLGSNKEDENREELTKILKELEAKKGPFYDTWLETKKWSIDMMNEAYDWADVKFDHWFFESELDSPSLKKANELFEQGILIKSQGAIGMDLEAQKLGFCMLIKSDGTGLYSTKDVALAIEKFDKFNVEKNIYIVDNRQAYHFKQVFAVLEKIDPIKAKDCIHLAYDVVELPSGAMSSRDGNIIPLMELIHKMESTIISRYLEKYREEWEKGEIENTAKIIANGAIKYGMIRVDNNRKIVFDIEEWLKLDGETGPYLQYVFARINSLLQKQKFDSKVKVDYSLLNIKVEQELMIKLSTFNDVVYSAHLHDKTSTLCSYLYELGKLYNSFYAECTIQNAESIDLKNARLSLSSSTAKIMKKGLSLLGIDVPERM